MRKPVQCLHEFRDLLGPVCCTSVPRIKAKINGVDRAQREASFAGSVTGRGEGGGASGLFASTKGGFWVHATALPVPHTQANVLASICLGFSGDVKGVQASGLFLCAL